MQQFGWVKNEDCIHSGWTVRNIRQRVILDDLHEAGAHDENWIDLGEEKFQQ